MAFTGQPAADLSENSKLRWNERGRNGREERESGMPKQRSRRPATRRKRWSQQVTRNSNALDLEGGVFSKRDPKSIARSLKRSAERSRRRKSDPYRSAMSMLTFYVNRAGKQLSSAKRARLQKAKEELRRLYKKRPATS